ncbi:hypothetical protein MNB_SM-7-130 [hydrothermal vent metagenome]|uniref:Uncharacterized protein n=1 Tax=hydrothermal vent metagenome TaxID=652676 RepID=A0A1W1BC95_9ZZZZ
MDWLNELKVAIVSKNPQKISSLLDRMPTFEKLQQMQEALYLLKEAYTIIDDLKSKTLIQRNQIKKNIQFLNATAKKERNSLDVSY